MLFASRAPLSHNPSTPVITHQPLSGFVVISKGLNKLSRSFPLTVLRLCSGPRALLAFKGNELCHGGQLRSQKINIHCVSVTLCEYLSQYEASRDREPCNQYLLVVPSEELDFTIRSACSPDSTSNIIS